MLTLEEKKDSGIIRGVGFRLREEEREDMSFAKRTMREQSICPVVSGDGGQMRSTSF